MANTYDHNRDQPRSLLYKWFPKLIRSYLNSNVNTIKVINEIYLNSKPILSINV